MKLIIDALTFRDRKATGYQSYLFNLLDHFAARRAELRCKEVIVAIPAGQETHFARWREQISTRTFEVNGFLDLFVEQNRLRRTLSLDPGDVILNTYNYSSLVRQARHILVIHDLQSMRLPQYSSPAFRWQRRLFVPRSIQIADRVVAISEFTASEIQSFYGPLPPHKLRVIRNYFNFGKYGMGGPQAPATGAASGTGPSAKPYFLCVSSFNPHKNIICLLRAFQRFVAESPDLPHRLMLTGSFEQLDSGCRHFIESTGLSSRLDFAGYVDDETLGRLYAGATAFVLPTQYEGLGMPIAEALYFDKPVLLSDLPVCREVASPFGQYFDPLDPASLVPLLRRAATSAMPVSARQAIEHRFSAASTSQRYIELINEFAA